VTLPQWGGVVSGIAATGTTTTYVWNMPANAQAGAYMRVVQE